MEGLVGYIIRLKNFENSREWAEHAYNTGSTQGWNLKFFEGVDGRISAFEDHNISIYNHEVEKSHSKFDGKIKLSKLSKKYFPNFLLKNLSLYKKWIVR